MSSDTRNGRFGPVEWSVAARALPGQDASGDEAVAIEVDGLAAVFGVIDGLGHGPAAASAATRAAAVVGLHVAQPLDQVLDACHRELSDTRGAAITLARIDFEASTLQWTGVGNVSAALLSRTPGGLAATSFVRGISGIVGFQMPHLLAAEVLDVRPGHLLVMATDGVTEDHLDELDFAAPADAIAKRILGEHTRVTDDALVLVARHRGAT